MGWLVRVWLGRVLVGVLALGAAGMSSAGAQTAGGVFAQPVVVKTGNWPVFVTTADVNGDGYPDLIYIDQGATSAASTTHVLLNDGKGNFTPWAVLATAGTSLAVGDFIGDGSVDLGWLTYTQTGTSSAGTPQGFVEEHIATGAGFYKTITIDGFDLNAQQVPQFAFLVGGQLRDTGSTDLIAADVANSAVYVFHPGVTANALLLASYSAPLAAGVGPVTVADVNADGHEDLVVEGSTGKVAQVFLGNGDGIGTDVQPSHIVSGSGQVASVMLRDVTGDGIVDLIAEGAAGRIDVFAGNGDGTYSSPSIGGTGTLNGTTGNGGRLIALADLNHDGQLDALTATPAGLSALLGQGTAYFGLKGIYNAGPGMHTFATADFNGDGNLDVATDSPEGIAILYGNADGSFQPGQAFAAGQPAMSGALGKFTASGHVDAVVSTGATQAQLLLGAGDGTFSAVGGATSPLPAAPGNGIAGLWSTVAVGDFNGDGLQDVLLTADGPNALIPRTGAATSGAMVQFGNGAGGFSTASSPFFEPLAACPQAPEQLYGRSVAGDFNGDGIGDYANRDSHLERVLLGVAGQTLPANGFSSVDTDCSLHAHDVVVAGDLNGDGRADLVEQTDGSLEVELKEAQGTLLLGDLSVDGALTTPGQLTAPALSTTFGGSVASSAGGLGFPAFVGSAAIADLDGDGNGDLIVAYDNMSADHTAPSAAAPNYIYLWFGSGGGKFLTSAKHPVNPVRLTPSRNFYQVAVVDVNGDGIPDLILSDGYILSVQYGKGDGTFGAEQHYLAGQGIDSISAADLRGNGRQDLVVANGGAVLTNPVANKEVLAVNPDVNTGGVTVLLNQQSASATAPAVEGTVTASPEPSAAGSPFAITFNGPGLTGTVQFAVDGASVGTAVTLVNGTVSVVDSTLVLPGSHALTATYLAANSALAVQFTGTHTVTLAPTTVVLTPTTPLQIYYGGTVDGTFTVTSTSGQPLTGTVTVFDNGVAVSYCTNLPYANGNAGAVFCPYGDPPDLLDAGVHTLTIAYNGGPVNGDPVNGSSISVGVTYTVLPDLTSATLQAAPTTQTVGLPVVLTATVTGNMAVPIELVTFYDGTTAIGTGTLNVAGVATFTTSSLAVGVHTITAVYGGALNFDMSPTSNPVTVTIIPAATAPEPTTVALSSNLNPAAVGDAVTFSAMVSVTGPFAQTAAGTVTFLDGTAVIGTGTLNASGVAAFTTSTLTVGSHAITASYPGSSATGSSAATSPMVSPVLTEVVTAAATPGGNALTLTVTPNPFTVQVGRTGILLVTVGGALAVTAGGAAKAVRLSCSGLPQESGCSFASPTLQAGGATTLDVNVSAPHDCGAAGNVNLSGSNGMELPAGGALAAVLLGCGLAAGKRRRLSGVLLLLALGVVAVGVNGCGYCTDLGTRPGGYTFTVTATPQSGTTAQTVSESVRMNVVVQ